MLSLLSQYSAYIPGMLLVAAQLVHTNARRKLSSMSAVFVSIGIFYLLLNGVDKLFVFEVSIVISVMATMKIRNKFDRHNLFYLICASIGCLIISVYEYNGQFFLELLHLSNQKEEQNTNIATVTMFIATIIAMGCIPFAEWMMHLFSSMSSTANVPIFIIPMYLSLQVYSEIRNDIGYENLFSSIGTIICVCSCIQIFFLKNIKIILRNVATFFYGGQTIAISAGLNLNLSFTIASAIILSFEAFFMPKIALKYRIKNCRDIFLSNRFDTSVFIISAAMLLMIYLNFVYQTCDSTSTGLALSLFVGFFAKFLPYIIRGNNTKSHYIRIVNTRSRVKMVVVLILIALTMISSAKNTTFVLQNNFIKQTILVILTFIFTTILFRRIQTMNVPRQIKLSTYTGILASIFTGIRIFFQIVETIANDIFFFAKNDNEVLNRELIKVKINNLLHNNFVLFQTLVIVLLCVVLIIECVII